MAYGKGALPSPPDDRDWQFDGHLAGAVGSALPSFRLGNRPPVLNQLDTPMCVAFSTSVEQNWQDHAEHGRFFDFWESLFFQRIGGNSQGAFMRAALDELLTDGYPEADSTLEAFEHRCASYVAVTKSVSAIKSAIVNFGGVLVIGPWFDNWTEGLGPLAVLPRPSGGGTGHAWWGVGWDEYGMLCQNSWGPLWGDNGLFRMPWSSVLDTTWEVWGTLDEITTEKLERKVQVNRPADGESINIRFVPPELGDHDNIFAQAREHGIWRLSTRNRIGNLSYQFTFKRWHISPDGSRWAIVRGFRRRLAIRKSLIHFVPQ